VEQFEVNSLAGRFSAQYEYVRSTQRVENGFDPLEHTRSIERTIFVSQLG